MSIVLDPPTASQRFKLSDYFLSQYKDQQPKWGYGLLSYITYKRTYSRTLPDGSQEEWWQTVQRVVEGCYNIQKRHCKSLFLPWSNEKSQRSAQIMYDLIFNFKFTPPGRGLEHMGGDYIYEDLAASLLNCCFVSTKDLNQNDLGAPFAWSIVMLALGVGTGFDVKGAGKVDIVEPIRKPETVFMVPDSREGWAKTVSILLNAYAGKGYLPTFDYSEVRPKGSPIKRLGGVSAGPQPLIDLIRNLDKLCTSYLGKTIDSTFIVDVFNYIGVCVVSGGRRRTAEIALGSADDEEFMSLKEDMEALGERRYTSNNSILCTQGMDYTKSGDHTATHGEPGYLWLDTIRAYGRLIDQPNWADSRVDGTNPCQPTMATVLTPNGISTMGQILPGDTIWSGSQWTIVTNKVYTGIKPVYEYKTRAGIFLGTEQHKVFSGGSRIEAQHAENIDICQGPISHETIDPQDIMDGLVMGDGTTHSGNLLLVIGQEDQDYSSSEIGSLIHQSYSKDNTFKVSTTISNKELVPTFNRSIPNRFFTGSRNKVCGFLRGLYSANGSVVKQRVTLKASSFSIIQQAQQMLSSLGIRSYYTTNSSQDVVFPNGTYTCKQSYDLNISTDRDIFRSSIGFIQKYKQEKLDAICSSVGQSKYSCSRPKNNYEVVETNFIDNLPVWDITVEADEHSYWSGGLLVSNCSEQSLESYEACCLVETYPAHHNSLAEYLKTLKYAYLYAKTVTLLPTHDARTNAVQMRNRRIGVSQTGIVQAINKRGYREFMNWSDRSYKYLKDLDVKYSDWLCIPRSVKISSVKPSGSVSLLSGSTPGIHFPESEYYIRRVRIHESSDLIKICQEAGLKVEIAVREPNTYVIEFPIKETDFTRSKKDVSIWEQLNLAADLQKYWADNQVSSTVTFNKSEAPLIKVALSMFEDKLKSISFLPYLGEDSEALKAYPQLPYEAITKEQYESIVTNVDETKAYKLIAELSGTKDSSERFCDGQACELK